MITYGSDPELMLFDREENRIVSSIPVLQKDKYDPIELKHGKMYADNVLVELAFDPVKSKKDFIKSLNKVFTEAHKVLGPKYKLLPKAGYEYPVTELKKLRVYNPKLNKEYDIDPNEVGCHPSIDVYKLDVNEIPHFESGYRTGSFHIHLGGKRLKEFDTKIHTIKLLDLIVGCSSVVFCKDKSAKGRRKYYGRAGEFRDTSYGIEYRVLDNFALSNPRLVDLTMDLVDYTLDLIHKDKAEEILNTVNTDEVQKAINESNKGMAMKLINRVLPETFIVRVKAEYAINQLDNWL